MKRKNLSIFVAVIAMMITLTNCEKNEAVKNTANGNIASEEAIEKAITFVGQGRTVNYLGINTIEEKLKLLGLTPATRNDQHSALICTIARAKTNCLKGLGLCYCNWPWVTSLSNLTAIEDNCLYLNADKVDFNNFKMELYDKPNIDVKDVQFIIDEDINVYDEKGNVVAIIYAGNYPFSSKIGEFGGFTLKSAYVK